MLSFRENRVFAFWHQNPRWQIAAILDFRGPIISSLKSLCTTSYIVNRDHSSKLLSFWENRVFAIWRQTDKQTYRHTNRWTRPSHEAAFAVASGGLIRCQFYWFQLEHKSCKLFRSFVRCEQYQVTWVFWAAHRVVRECMGVCTLIPLRPGVLSSTFSGFISQWMIWWS